MQFDRFDIDGPLLVTPRKFEDARGMFMETFKAADFNAVIGEKVQFVQDNHSLSVRPGTVRGLHYQSPPHAQAKLVRCIAGKVIDVIVDVRSGSPTYGQHLRAELSQENAAQLWVPAGFLHGFATLAPNSEVLYKVTDVYAPDCDGSVRWDDPVLGINWGLGGLEPVLSDKDAKAQSFAEFNTPF